MKGGKTFIYIVIILIKTSPPVLIALRSRHNFNFRWEMTKQDPPVLISPLLTKLWVLGISREIVQTNCFSVQSCWLEYTGFRKWRFFTCAPAILLIKCIKKDCTLAFPCHVIPVFHISHLGIHFQRTRCQIAQIYQWQI